jgi:hypothetical protein
MALRDSWRKALALSGLVDDSPPAHPDYLLRPPPEPAEPPPAVDSARPALDDPPRPAPAWAASAPAPTEDPTAGYRHDDAGQIVVRRIGATAEAPPPAAAAAGDDEIVEVFGGAEAPAPPYHAAPPPPPPAPSPPPLAAAARPARTLPVRDVGVHRISPRSFNDAQLLADRYKASTPVILDLQGVETDLAKRLIGFASGLTYGLEGGMERLDDRVFLLTPRGVEIPSGQRARLAAQGSLNRA